MIGRFVGGMFGGGRSAAAVPNSCPQWIRWHREMAAMIGRADELCALACAGARSCLPC